MAKTRSMTRNQNHDEASSRKRMTIRDNGDAAPWADLNHHLLFIVMMQLGVVDFVAFSGVCKAWRSLAIGNWNKFMMSRPPMSMWISYRPYKKECYLKDFEGRKFKTLLPHSAGRTCVGSTCGYVILFGRKTRDFWLVNPITRHELHFPAFPFYESIDPSRASGLRAILLSSPSVSEWVFLVIHRFTSIVSFYIVGKRAWNHVSSAFHFVDLRAFMGKIYTIDTHCRLCELILRQEPKLILLQTKNAPKPYFRPEFVSSGGNLYVMDRLPQDPYYLQELHFGEMKWVTSPKETIREYAFFLSKLKYSAAIKPESWADHRSQYDSSCAYFLDTSDRSQKGNFFDANMWYFPHDCLNVNLIRE